MNDYACKLKFKSPCTSIRQQEWCYQYHREETNDYAYKLQSESTCTSIRQQDPHFSKGCESLKNVALEDNIGRELMRRKATPLK